MPAKLSSERLAMINDIVNGGSLLEKWERDVDVTTYDDLEMWAKRHLREVLVMRSRRERNGMPEEDKLEDFLVGKQAILSMLLANMRQIKERSAEGHG